MEKTNEFKINYEAQKICSKFHYGWVSKKEIGIIEKDINLFRDVQKYLSLMGYELINPSGTDWYVIRLKKEYDSSTFDYFLKRVKGIDRRHLALLTIIYIKLVLPKELKHVEPDVEISLTVEEIVYNYGSKFQQGKRNTKKTIESLLIPLKKYNYIFFEKCKSKISVGPAMYMLHSNMLMDICKYVIQNLYASSDLTEKLDDINQEGREDK